MTVAHILLGDCILNFVQCGACLHLSVQNVWRLTFLTHGTHTSVDYSDTGGGVVVRSTSVCLFAHVSLCLFGTTLHSSPYFVHVTCCQGTSVAKWLACWTQAQEGPGSNRSCDADG